MMKTVRILTAAALLAVFATGCESFRDSGEDSGKSEKRASGKSKKSAERRKSKRSRDPRDDMFFGAGGAKAESFSRDGLNAREQRLLDEELRREDEEMKDLRRRRRSVDPNRSKRKEWVYGFKPLGSDK